MPKLAQKLGVILMDRNLTTFFANIIRRTMESRRYVCYISPPKVKKGTAKQSIILCLIVCDVNQPKSDPRS